jgi:hypothetical protein
MRSVLKTYTITDSGVVMARAIYIWKEYQKTRENVLENISPLIISRRVPVVQLGVVRVNSKKYYVLLEPRKREYY